MAGVNKGAGRYGSHRAAFESAKKKIYATQSVCGICGLPVDFTLRYPHPLAPCIDHIVPMAKGGHPSDMDNLQLSHWTCNRQKSDKLVDRPTIATSTGGDDVDNHNLPWSVDWRSYRASKAPQKSASLEGQADRPKKRKIY